MARKGDPNAPYWQQLRTAERGIIEYALEHGQTIRGTATILGVSPNFLSERMRELGIPAPDVRPGPKPGTKRPQRPQLRVVSETGGDDAPLTETLDEDTPEEESEEGEKWYEDAEEDEDADETTDEDADAEDDDAEDEDQDDGEDASAQGN